MSFDSLVITCLSIDLFELILSGFNEFYECLDSSDLPGISNVTFILKFLSHLPWLVIPVLVQFQRLCCATLGFFCTCAALWLTPISLSCIHRIKGALFQISSVILPLYSLTWSPLFSGSLVRKMEFLSE